MCKSLIEKDDKGRRSDGLSVLDHNFINEHVHGFDDFAANARNCSWEDLERQSGLSRIAIEAAAAIYARAERVIAIYGMGLTQHRAEVETVQMLVNLLLLRGNIGKPGAGICPVRGHSNVQGQRTVGITEKPELVPLDRLARQFAFEPSREKGMNTVEVCEGIIDGRVAAFVMLGGNFVRAIPERERMEKAWRELRLTVSISTKLTAATWCMVKSHIACPASEGPRSIDKRRAGKQFQPRTAPAFFMLLADFRSPRAAMRCPKSK
jgi:anaerobic selenocysteine-containing dehydrogenase